MSTSQERKRPAPDTDETEGPKRPRAPGFRRALTPIVTSDRFDKEVLGSQLWHAECSGAVLPSGSGIPLEFASAAEYVSILEPLVLAEAREAVRSDWAEACAAGQARPVRVVSVEAQSDGWLRVRLRPAQKEGGPPDGGRLNPSQGQVAVLTSGAPPTSGALAWASRSPQAAAIDAARGTSAAQGADVQDTPEASGHASHADSCSAGDAGGASAPAGPGGVQEPSTAGRGADLATASSGVFAVAGAVASGGRGEKHVEILVRAACARHALAQPSDPPPPCAAATAALRRAAGMQRSWHLVCLKPLISERREFEVVHRAAQLSNDLLPYILKPTLLQEPARAYDDPSTRQHLWPAAARSPKFIQHLQRQYDYSQLIAIEMAACHLGAAASRGPPGAGREPALPFTLIQGPPGTGKTHTVKGVLNVWHLVAYQGYFDGLIAAALSKRGPAVPPPRASALSGAGGNVVEALRDDLASSLSAAVQRTRPRILVCTPSNAACDELLSRVMHEGFCDGDGAKYHPNVIRVGSDFDKVIAPAVRPRAIGHLIQQQRAMTRADWHRQHAELSRRRQRTAQEIELLEAALAREMDANDSTELARRLVDRHQAQVRTVQELERLAAARVLVWGGAEEWRVREAEQEVETSLLMEAEMVFTTLSSTQRRLFQQAAAKAPFKTVLIDEAGQASEIASLQPLVHGAERAVLVGDPQQLPATIRSELGRAMDMERSLFERLQRCGAPVSVLSVQYRMHPAIRQFPSTYFYANRLEDADSVRRAPDEPYYGQALMKPYVVFDVARGVEQRAQAAAGSLSNLVEAELAAALFHELRAFLVNLAKSEPGRARKPTSVGVITPYREQRALLRRTFQAVVGKAAAAEVLIETVDSFQGKQLDVIIFSCVRAKGGGGLGFITDVRRLNVAITRAKRALWILGSLSKLQADPTWNALIQDAERRRVIIRDADAESLFPAMEYWARKRAPVPPAPPPVHHYAPVPTRR